MPAFDLRFKPYASLRSTVKINRGSRTAHVNLSDMLEDAPPEVLGALATIILSRLYRLTVPAEVHKRYKLWTLSPSVQERMLAMRRKRGRKRVLAPAGTTHDLDELFDQLNQRHFGGTLRKPRLGWSPGASRRRLGHFDPAHDVIVISRVFDRAEVPKILLEYVLFHEMLHVKHPTEIRGTRRCVHTPEFQAEERTFPRFERIQHMLRSL